LNRRGIDFLISYDGKCGDKQYGEDLKHFTSVAGCNGICLPFALTETEAAEAGTFWTLNSYDSNTGNIHLKKRASR
jgi:hypothetical protein